MSIEGVAVLAERNLVHTADRAREDRIQIASERLQRVGDGTGHSQDVSPVNLPAFRRFAVLRGIPIEPLAWLLVLVEEVRLDPVEHTAGKTRSRHRSARDLAHGAGENHPAAVMYRAIGEKPFNAARQPSKHVPKALERLLARALGGQVARTAGQRAVDGVIDDEPSVDHVGEAVAQPLLAQLGEEQPDVVVGSGQPAADVERAIERFLHQTRRLRLVRHLEAGIEIRLERKLAEQREAERIDGADGDVSRSLANVAPSIPVGSGHIRALADFLQNALAHLGRRLAREGDREDVGRLDATRQQIEVAVHEHMRLAGAGRGFEHDVVGGIDRARARGVVDRPSSIVGEGSGGVFRCVSRENPSRPLLERQPVRRHRRNPCGTRRRGGSACT